MTSVVQMWDYPFVSVRTLDIPDFNAAVLGETLSIERLPSEPVGTTAVTFAGVHANSEIRVYLPNGIEAAGVENCSADHVLTWGAYLVGNANNIVTIRIVHPSYKIKEFAYTTVAGVQSIPVQQEVDKWYSNP